MVPMAGGRGDRRLHLPMSGPTKKKSFQSSPKISIHTIPSIMR